MIFILLNSKRKFTQYSYADKNFEPELLMLFNI